MRLSSASLGLLFLLALHPFALAQVSMTMQMGKPDTPVVGLPFSADQSVRTVQHLATGAVLSSEIKGHIYRSADGVERYDGAIVSTDPAHPEPVLQALILDHAKRTSILLNSKLKTATLQHLPAQAAVSVSFLPQRPPTYQNKLIKPENPTTEDLGKKTLGMRTILGKRVTGVIPAGTVGNDQPLQVTAEVWFAPDLKLIVNQIDKNPLAGERTYELTNIRGDEPDPSLFQVPDGYTLKEQAPMPVPNTLPNLGAVKPPEQRTKQIEDALNSPDPDVKNNVAFALAYNGDHLTDAETIANQFVQIIEQQTADVLSGGDEARSFHQMLVLSRAWATLGFVYYRQGQQQKAERFTHAAWELNPNELYCSHLGRIYEAQHRPSDAVAFYRMALNTEVTGAEQDLLLTRLTALGVPKPEPLKIDVATPLPLLKLHLDAGENSLVDILLKHDAPPAITLREGNPALAQPLREAIQSALAQALPDNGPEQLLRRARISCTSGDTPACSLHFVGSSEASDESPTSTRSPSVYVIH